MRNCAATTLSQLINVHHNFLATLQRAVPFSDRMAHLSPARRHARWYSVDGSPPTRKNFDSVRRERRSLNLRRSSSGDGDAASLCEPATIATIAAVFTTHMSSFSAYDEFGEHYELLRYAVDQAQQSVVEW